MGTAYTDLVGAPPAPNTLRWRDWYHALLAARLAECPLNPTGAKVYYFDASSGSDSNSGTDVSAPKATMAEAQKVHDSFDGPGILLFKRGEIWREATGLNITKTNVVVGAYGDDTDGSAPILSRFTETYLDADNVWALASGDRYTVAETTEITWLREIGDPLAPYTRVASTAEVESTARSFWWSANVLHVNAGASIDPNGVDFEAVPSNAEDGIEVSGDGCRIDSIVTNGWGADINDTNNQRHGIRITCTGTDSVVVTNCESYVSGSHTLAAYSSTTGGHVTVLNCRSGYCLDNGAGGQTVINTYADSGGGEYIIHDCEVKYGTLPNGTSFTREGLAFHNHTTTGTANLYIRCRCRILDDTFGCTGPSILRNMPSASELTDVRSYIVDEYVRIGAGCNTHPFEQNTVAINPDWEVVSRDNAVSCLSTSTASGWVLNGEIVVDFRDSTQNRNSLYNTAVLTNNPKMFHTRLRLLSNGILTSIDFDTFLGSTNSSENAEARNCVFIGEEDDNVRLGLNNDAGKIANNAYLGIEDQANLAGFGNDIYAIDLTTNSPTSPTSRASSCHVGQHPFPDDMLYRSGRPFGEMPEYDQRWNPRDTGAPSVGPLEPLHNQTFHGPRTIGPKGTFFG